MDRTYEAKYHALEQRHWWFRGRREAVRALVEQICRPYWRSAVRVGVLMRELRVMGYTSVIGIDVSAEAIAECHRRGTSEARLMDAQKLDFPDAHFDLLTASDVLEHLADDEGALRDWHRVLKPGGALIIFVPAFRSLWSGHDAANQHFRRYRVAELENKAAAAGFVLERRSYWNSSLFLPIALARAMKRLMRNNHGRGVPDSDLFPPPPVLNWTLLHLLRTENATFRRGSISRSGSAP